MEAEIAVERFFHEGVRLMGSGEGQKAIEAFRQALHYKPDLVEAHVNLGLLLASDRRWAEAETHYRQAIELRPGQMETFLNYGGLLLARKRLAEAENAFRKALQLAPQSPVAWTNLGVVLASLKREAEAESCHRMAMAIAPDYRTAPFNLAYLLLRQGRYEEGWRCFESRDWYRPIEERLPFPRWQGQSLAGQAVLITIEAGHGDMIQFCRYAAQLKQAGARQVGALCHPGLTRLFGDLCGIDTVLPADQALPTTGWDYWTPALSLPFRFGTRLDTVPAALPYLSVDTRDIARCARLTASAPGILRVGLVWKGNSRFENDADRSLPSLQTLAPLAAVPGIRFFSLQKGAGEDEARIDPPFPIVDLAPQIADFADTAALIGNLDLVIAVDTAVAHLAGALGKDCWVMLPDYQTDWRWLADRADSPWYPGVMRLFRQKSGGDWHGVVAGIQAALPDYRASRLSPISPS